VWVCWRYSNQQVHDFVWLCLAMCIYVCVFVDSKLSMGEYIWICRLRISFASDAVNFAECMFCAECECWKGHDVTFVRFCWHLYLFILKDASLFMSSNISEPKFEMACWITRITFDEMTNSVDYKLSRRDVL
jgi:hypothetical protein